MSRNWPKQERTVGSWENMKAEQDTETIIIDDDDLDSSLWHRRMKSESPYDMNDDKGWLPVLNQPHCTDQKQQIHQAVKPKTKKANYYRMRRKKASGARFKLAKIARKEAKGRGNHRDVEDKARCQAELDEFEKYKMRNPLAFLPKRLAIKNRASPTRFRNTHEVTKDNLVMALVDELHEDGQLLNQKWEEIETRLANMVTDRLMAVPEGPIPSFDSSDVIRGHRVIRCDDGFSKIFLAECVDTIGDTWDGLRIRLVHVSEIPWRPRARIWLPKGQRDHSRILSCLRGQNLDVDMSDWSILRAEEDMSASQPFLLLINRRCLPQLEAADYKVRYGIRMAKLKVLFAETDDLPVEDEEIKYWRQEDDIPHSSTYRHSY